MQESSPEASGRGFAAGKKTLIIIAVSVVAVIVAAVLAYAYGRAVGYDSGYEKARADIASLQEESARKAAEEAAKAANPFQAVNPLEGVEANPFEKAKKVLNPFEN